MKNVIIYDFDGTLTPYSLPKFEILEKSGMKGGAHNPKFLELSKQKSKDKNIDLYEAMYETYFEIIKSANFDLKDETFCLGYNNVDYNEVLELRCFQKKSLFHPILKRFMQRYLIII